MTEDDKFEAFMQKVMQRPLPENQMARIRILARELAEGATENLWQVQIYSQEFTEPHLVTQMGISANPDDENTHLSHTRTNVTDYVERRWGFDNLPDIQLLGANGYADRLEDDFLHAFIGIRLTQTAFQLLQEAEASTVFISYKRSESSAFALLVNTRLKAEGINSYLDMSIPKGDDWQKRIKDEIEKHDYFVLLLNSQTLSSEVIRQELAWGIQFGKTIIPIWHYGYAYESGKFPVLLEVDEVLKRTNAIRVLEESALAYNNAIVELLNRFGVTP